MKRLVLALLVVINTVFLTGCGDDSSSSPPPPIVISGTVSSADGSLFIESAQVTLVNIETQQNELDPVFTDVKGFYTFMVY